MKKTTRTKPVVTLFWCALPLALAVGTWTTLNYQWGSPLETFFAASLITFLFAFFMPFAGVEFVPKGTVLLRKTLDGWVVTHDFREGAMLWGTEWRRATADTVSVSHFWKRQNSRATELTAQNTMLPSRLASISIMVSYRGPRTDNEVLAYYTAFDGDAARCQTWIDAYLDGVAPQFVVPIEADYPRELRHARLCNMTHRSTADHPLNCSSLLWLELRAAFQAVGLTPDGVRITYRWSQEVAAVWQAARFAAIVEGCAATVWTCVALRRVEPKDQSPIEVTLNPSGSARSHHDYVPVHDLTFVVSPDHPDHERYHKLWIGEKVGLVAAPAPSTHIRSAVPEAAYLALTSVEQSAHPRNRLSWLPIVLD